jgi:hypothetical protein
MYKTYISFVASTRQSVQEDKYRARGGGGGGVASSSSVGVGGGGLIIFSQPPTKKRQVILQLWHPVQTDLAAIRGRHEFASMCVCLYVYMCIYQYVCM